MTLGSTISDAAEKKYATKRFQRALARDVECSNSTISRIVRDDSTIHSDTITLRKISEWLKLDYLLLLYLNKDLTVEEFKRASGGDTPSGSKPSYAVL